MIESYLAGYEAFSRNGGREAPQWARSLRMSGITRFADVGFPATKNEDWHFTSVAPIAERAFAPLTSRTGKATAAELAPYGFGATDWHTLVFVNGRFDASLSSAGALPDGVELLPLARAYDELPLLLEQHVGRIASMDAHAFTALNTAFINDGAVVHVSADVEVARPIHLLFVSDAQATNGVAQPRTLIVLDRFAKATVIESYVGLEGSGEYFTNAVTEATLADGATLTHLKLQREAASAYHVGTVDVRQGRDSHLVSFSFATGALLSRTNVYTELRGEGCGATLNGLYLGDGRQHIDHQTRIEHVEPNCYSRELYKGILDGSAHGVFNGKVYVHPAAQKTDGKQTNKTLLLSEKAQIDTKPQLEIFADDVKCTHGATVGRLDATSLFYMKSRGIAERTARELLTYAFAADVLETIELAEVREGLEAATLQRYTER